jgi:hypothetical protein
MKHVQFGLNNAKTKSVGEESKSAICTMFKFLAQNMRTYESWWFLLT